MDVKHKLTKSLENELCPYLENSVLRMSLGKKQHNNKYIREQTKIKDNRYSEGSIITERIHVVSISDNK